jgi:hypothetical protein
MVKSVPHERDSILVRVLQPLLDFSHYLAMVLGAYYSLCGWPLTKSVKAIKRLNRFDDNAYFCFDTQTAFVYVTVRH